MRKLKRLLARIYDMPNAYRVLEIMDKCGCDISPTQPEGSETIYWEIKPKWWVSYQEAKDLQTIVLHHHQYKARSKIWSRIIFGNEFREWARISPEWFD